MSASREKKKRQEQAVAETPVVETKKGMSKGLKTVLGVVIALVLVAVIVFFAMINFGFFESHTTAAVVNGHKLTPAMVNYYYTAAYSNSSEMLSYLTDTSLPLDEQECALIEGGTWSDYLMEYALSTASSTYAIYDEAIANGYTLSEDSQAAIASELKTLDLMAAMYSYGSGDAFLTAQYGRGCNSESYEEFLTVNYIAQEYANKIYGEFTYTQDELDAYYAENASEFEGYNFRLFTVKAETVENEADETASVTEETMTAAEETAKAMAEASQGNEQAFIDLALENASEEDKATYEDEAATLNEDLTASSIAESIREWVTDDARVEGDTTYALNGTEDGYYVLYYIGTADHTYQLPNVRHILIGVDDATDTEAKETAKAKAEALLEEFLAGDATEEAFAALANENSTDTGSNTTGGLYENIVPGMMVEAFENWCYEDHEVGDTGIVESSYGYHIMYFSGYGKTYESYLAENAMLEADYSAWTEAVSADASYELVSDRFVTTR